MMRKFSLTGAVLIGINAILIQTILIRELLVNFSGNELSMGIIFATWLVGGAIGSLAIGRRLIDRIREPASAFAYTFFLISLIIPITIFFARIVRAIFNIPIYEMIGPIQILYICAFILLPIASLLSLSFVICCKMLKEASDQNNTAGLVYVFEAAGATLAGTIFAFLLAKHLNSFQVAFLLVAINLIILLCQSIILKKRAYLSAGLLSLVILAAILNLDQFLHKRSQSIQWQPQEVIAYRHSPYGNISVTKIDKGFNFYENGSLLFTTEDEFFNEEFIHLVILQHPDPKDILLIGSGIGGALRQILKHNPRRVTYLELDPLTVKIGKDFLSRENRDALLDSRLEILHEDGRFFINRATDEFDVIIVNLPDPTTLQLNRFYTEEFYKKASMRLKEDGILAARVSSKESIISHELAQYNASVYKTLKSAFGFVDFVPGDMLLFIASNSDHIHGDRPEALVRRFDDRRLKTSFLTTYHIQDKYYPDTYSYFSQRLSQYHDLTRINKDFYPVCFYYDLILWGTQFHSSVAILFKAITEIDLAAVIGAIAIFFVLGLIIIGTKKDSTGPIVPVSIGVCGALSITVEIVIILAFQINYGYVYEKVGFLVGLFMLGVALGGYTINRIIPKCKEPLKFLCSIVLVYTLFIFSVPAGIKITISVSDILALAIFYSMILLAGIGIGCQFPVAVVILQKRRTSYRAAAIVWGADLLGATIGILLSSLVLIPSLGIFRTILAGGILVGTTFLLLILSLRRLQQ